MRLQVLSWLKPHSKKKLILEIVGVVMAFLLVGGGILFQVNPQFRQHVLCPFCDPNIYVTSQTIPSDASAPAFVLKDTFLYKLDIQTGKVKQATYLSKLGGFDQKIVGGVSYILACQVYISINCTNAILLAIRLSDGATLWRKVLDPSYGSVAVTSTMLYMRNNSDLIALNLQDGRQIWHYDLQSDAYYTVILDNNKIFLQEYGKSGFTSLTSHRLDKYIALDADTGKTLWSYALLNSDFTLPPVADNGHLFFVSIALVTADYAQKTSTVVEFDENTGARLWQKKTDGDENIASLYIKSHCLLIETEKHKLYVLRESDKSVIFSYAFPSSYALPHPNYKWIYNDDIAYGLSTEVNPQTFASNRVMRAWQISDGRELFQINLDIDGEFEMVRMQDQLIFTSISDNNSDRAENDVEARQAQTGTLLWHTHIGQFPTDKGYPWSLSVVDTTISSQDEEISSYQYSFTLDDNTYYLSDNGESNQSVLYISMYQYASKTQHMLYALDKKNGLTLWQVITDNLHLLHSK